jgi:hypothetical protein
VRIPPKKQRDRTDEECVLRFFAYLNRYNLFDHSVVGFLNDYMRDASRDFDYAAGKLVFEDTFHALSHLLPNGIHRESRKSTPINLFEAVAVGAALAIQQNGRLKRQRGTAWIDGGDLRKLTTGATNTKLRVAGRIEYCATKFGWTSA